MEVSHIVILVVDGTTNLENPTHKVTNVNYSFNQEKSSTNIPMPTKGVKTWQCWKTISHE